MAISYNKTVGVGASLITALGIAGGVLLGLGACAHGQTWQLITGGSLLGVAGVSAVAFTCYVLIPRSEERIREAFAREGLTSRFWTYGIASQSETEEIFYLNDKRVFQCYKGDTVYEPNIKKNYTRVIII